MLTSRQRRLLEARDPNYEKGIEPKLRAPISMYTGYTSPQKKIQRKFHDIWGYNFNSPPSHQANPGDYSSPTIYHHSEMPKNPYPKGSRPKGYTPSMIGPGELTRALKYWLKEFDGQRWPALEQAYLNRARSFTGGGGDYVRPRLSIFQYLNKLREPWPEGEAMMKKFMSANARGKADPFGDVLHNMGYKVGRGMLQSLINSKIENSAITDLVKKLLASEKQAPPDESDEDILTSTASRKFEDYSGFEDLLRRYARVFNLDGKNPEGAPSEKSKCTTAGCKRPAQPNDSLCGTCSRLRAQDRL